MTKKLAQSLSISAWKTILYLQKSFAGIFVISVGHPARVGVTAGRKKNNRLYYSKALSLIAKFLEHRVAQPTEYRFLSKNFVVQIIIWLDWSSLE